MKQKAGGQDATPIEPHGTILGGWFAVILAVIILAIAAFIALPKIAAKTWVSGDARVLSASVYQRSKSHDWCALIKFEHSVNGKVYKNSDFASALVSDGACHRQKERTEYVLRQATPGTSIRIFYDPASPSSAAIVRKDLNWLDYSLFIVSVVLFGFAIHQIRLGRAILRRSAH
jgi:hypothetical protein